MTDKEKYRLLCETTNNIPIFSQAWWLDAVCGETNWDVILIEERNQIVAAMPFYRPLKHVISMPSYTQTMGPLLFQESTNCKYTTLLSGSSPIPRVHKLQIHDFAKQTAISL